MKNIALTVSQRISLKELMPDKGSYEKLRAIQSINDKLDLSVKEIDFYEFKEVAPLTYEWNAHKEKEKPLEIEIGDVETQVIAGALKTASENENLRACLIPVYEVFYPVKELEAV